MRDGLQVVAKLPYPSTIPKRYATASEVATMDLVRLHGVPVPKIYDYSTTSQNPVGCEFIIMERVAGKELRHVWSKETPQQRLKMVEQVVKMESLLFSIKLPASGSVYYKRDLPADVETVDIPGIGGLDGLCIGPEVKLRWWDKERAQLPVDRKPHCDARDVLRAVGEKELAWMLQYARPRFPSAPLYREVYGLKKVSPTEHIRSLFEYLQISDFLCPKEPRMNRPVLRHPDLQPNNIFVSDSMDILSIIDWQHCAVLPLFLQAFISGDFKNFNDVEPQRLVNPQLPTDYSQLDPRQQYEARELYRRRQLHCFYLGYTSQLNEDHFDAMQLDHVVTRQRLFHNAGAPWEGDNVTLKADLIRATQVWQGLVQTEDGHFPECPLAYSKDEIERYLQLESQQREADTQFELACRDLGIGTDGWVPSEDYGEAQRMNREFKADALTVAETDIEREELQNHWPWDDHDEDDQD
ncbi:MAG: hypothetical protein LQ346_006539 [Caloplaca aetnensis]|nr:MAG: hypothetical protein LQ346_006539 [Caloplaca aetnensis]